MSTEPRSVIRRYRVVTSARAVDLDFKISDLINDGWQPTGGRTFNSVLEQYEQTMWLPMSAGRFLGEVIWSDGQRR